MTLPDTTEVWPGHLGGSMCGGPGMDLKIASTIGFERAHQELLRIEDEDEFVARSIARSGRSRRTSRPSSRSTAGRCVKEAVEAHPLTPRQVRRRATTARWSSTSARSCSSTRRTSRAR